MDVTGDQEIHEFRRIGSLNPDLPLDGDVPHAYVFGQIFVLCQQSAIFGFDVGARVVEVVVGGVCPTARGFREVPPGRFPDPGGDEHLSIAVPALPQIDWPVPRFESIDHQSLCQLITSESHWRIESGAMLTRWIAIFRRSVSRIG